MSSGPGPLDESAWEELLSRLAGLYTSLCVFNSMAAYVRGLAGRQLAELVSYVETRDLVSSALAGGMREECVDRVRRDPNAKLTPDCFPCDSAKRFFYHGLGVGLSEDFELEARRLRPLLVVGYYGQRALASWRTRMMDDVSRALSIVEAIYDAAGAGRPQCVAARPNSADDVGAALGDLVNSAAELLPGYSPVIRLALALYSSSSEAVREALGVDVGSEAVRGLAGRLARLAERLRGRANSVKSLSNQRPVSAF